MSVTVLYRTQKKYCDCCQQKLPEVKTSAVRDFVITKDAAQSWADWEEIETYPDDLDRLVPEFVREVIDFHRTSSYEKLIIEETEFEKVKKFILQEFGSPEPVKAQTPPTNPAPL